MMCLGGAVLFAMHTTATTASPTIASDRLRLVGTLAALGPIAFAVIVQSLILLQWDALSEFGDLDREFPISANALGPYGIVMVLNFVLVGVSVLALAYGIWKTARPSRVTKAGLALLALAGLGLVAEAAVMDFPPPKTWHGWIHFIAFFVWALALLISYVVLGIGLLRDARWRVFGWYTLATAVVTVFFVFFTGSLAEDPVTSHGAWWGPLGRLHFTVFIAWFSVGGWKIRRMASAPARAK